MRLQKVTILGVLIAAIIAATYFAEGATKIDTISLNAKNTIIFNQEITNISVDNFMSAVIGKRILLPEFDSLKIVLVSSGGNVGAATIMAKVINALDNVQVLCKYCASSAGLIFTLAKDRLVIDKSKMLMHESFLPKVTANLAGDQAALNAFITESDAFNKVFYTKIGISKKEYESKIINSEWIVEGDEIVSLHLADRKVKVLCDEYIRLLAPDMCKSKE